MAEESVRHAVIIQPPEEQWEKIQDIRSKHDKAFTRWMPHINLLYPFVSVNTLVVEKLTKAVLELQPFTISLNDFSFFEHSPTSCTLFLDPKPADDIVVLQSQLEKAFPDCDELSKRGGDSGFVPHLTLGQFSGTDETQEMIDQLSEEWPDISFEVDKIHVISRSGNDPFTIVKSIHLGKENKPQEKKKKNRIAESLVDESVTLEKIINEFSEFVSPTSEACVFVNVQEVAKRGAGVNTRDVLFKQQRFRAVQGNFNSIVSKFIESGTCSLPIFSLTEDIEKFCAHFSLPDDDHNNHEEFVASHARPGYSKEGRSQEEIQEVVERVKRWIKKMEPSLPTTRSKFLNATSSLRLLKSAVDPMLVLKCMGQNGKVNFCAPCRNFTLTPEAYVRGSKPVKGDEVSNLARKTVEWLCRQMRAPESVRALLDQIESFSSTKEIGSDAVWTALVEQGIVDDTEEMKYNLDAIHIVERPPPIDPVAQLLANFSGDTNPVPQQQQQHIYFPFDKTVAKSAKQQKPEPLHKFDEWPICENLLRGIYSYGFERPSLIQASVISVLLTGRDSVIQSQAGTGKTLAYCVPMLERIDVSEDKTQALVLVPNRELAMIVTKMITTIGSFHAIKTHALVGGLAQKADIDALAKGPHVIVGTCGRVLDMLERGQLDQSHIKCFVLDEADELLSEEGEKEAVYNIFVKLPKTVQAVFVSSTYTHDIQDMWEKALRDPCLFLIPRKKLIVGNVALTRVSVEEEYKVDTLADLYASIQEGQLLIFCNSKRKVDFLVETLHQKSFSASSIHGDISQAERDKTFADFVAGSARVLITTSQLSRGIDVTTVGRVLNYDFPPNAFEFYHRMGRTGRFGREGKCISFVTPDDEERVNYVERFFGKKLQALASQNI